MDGRYRLSTDTDVAISSIQWDKTAGTIKAVKSDNTQTANCNIDGRYIDHVNFSGSTFTFGRTTGTDTTVTLPTGRVDVPDGTRMLVASSAAPVGWVKITSYNDTAIRVVSGSGGGYSAGQYFSTVFSSAVDTGGSVDSSGLGVSGNVTTEWGSGNITTDINFSGAPSYVWGSGGGINTSQLGVGGTPGISMSNFSLSAGNLKAYPGNLYARSHSTSISQMPYHGHNYIESRTGWNGSNSDDARANVQTNRVMVQTGGTGSGSSHGHYMDGYGNVSGTPGYSGSISATAGSLDVTGTANISFPSIAFGQGNMAIGGNGVTDSREMSSSFDNGSINGSVSYTAGTINLNVSYVDVIICQRGSG